MKLCFGLYKKKSYFANSNLGENLVIFVTISYYLSKGDEYYSFTFTQK